MRTINLLLHRSFFLCTTAKRLYVPIFEKDPLVDRLSATRLRVQTTHLWGPSQPRISTLEDSLEQYENCGNDPALAHLSSGETSIYSLFAEDEQGTNLAFPASTEHLEDSRAYWATHYWRVFSNLLRLERRSATQFIGTLDGGDIMTDEADSPDTVWAQDSAFRELAFIAANFLKRKVVNMEQFEEAVLACGPDEYLQFLDSFKHHAPVLLPLPSSAGWYYEGEQREAWVRMWKPLQRQARDCFLPIIKSAVTSKTWNYVASRLADVLEGVLNVICLRVSRQCSNGIVRPYAELETKELFEVARTHLQRIHKGLLDGDFDPADPKDTSTEWTAEHKDIEALMNAFQSDIGFSLADFWHHIIRVDELEHEYIYTSSSFLDILASAYAETFRIVELDKIMQACVDSLRTSSFDLRSGSFAPGVNEVTARLLWVTYGSSTAVQHTPTAARQLLFHFSPLQLIPAAVAVRHALRPLSSSLNYTNPYKYRESYVRACVTYALSAKTVGHFFELSWFFNMANAEEIIARVTQKIKKRYGAVRRARSAAARVTRSASLPRTGEKAYVLAYGTEDSINLPRNARVLQDEKNWSFGSTRVVVYEYDSPVFSELRAMANSYDSTDTAQLLREKELKASVGIEISLFCPCRPKSEQTFDVDRLYKQHPRLRSIAQHVESFCQHSSGLTGVDESVDDTVPQSEWVFCTIIEDNAELTAMGTVDVRLPFMTAPDVAGRQFPLSKGEYRLRLRFFDNVANPSHDPTRCTEAFTSSFIGFDALPQLLLPHLIVEDPGAPVPELGQAEIAAEDLRSVCTTLRDGSIEVPLEVELDAGQMRTPLGTIPAGEIRRLLRAEDLRTLNRGLTPTQIALEPRVRRHWQWNVLVGADEEEWYTLRRAALEEATNYEGYWWRHDDWLQSVRPTGLGTLATRLQYGTDVSTLLSARNRPAGISPRELAGIGSNNDVKVEATISGDGNVESLIFDSYAIREKRPSVTQLLDAATHAIHEAELNLNALAAAKIGRLEKDVQIAAVRQQKFSVFGGTYLRTLERARERALQELGFETAEYSHENAVREVREIDRYASVDHPDLRKKLWNHQLRYDGTKVVGIDKNRQIQW